MTGSGTQFNMTVNEVISLGAYRPTTKCIAASVETCSFTL